MVLVASEALRAHHIPANPVRPASRQRVLLVAGLLAGLTTGMVSSTVGTDPATAQSAFDDPRARQQRRPARATRFQAESQALRERDRPRPRREAATRPVAPRVATAVPTPPAVRTDLTARPPEPLVAVISIASQRMQVYGSNGTVAETKVSTGQSGFRTPSGIFSIIQRNRYHESNIYSGAPMPFMQRITWSGIALHQGVVPGYPASHGCIRLPGDFASRMWGLGRIGMRVVIAPNDIAPVSFAHARLPAPQSTPWVAMIPSVPIQTAAVGAPTPSAEPQMLAPFQLAHARRAKAAAELIAAERAVKAAIDLAAEKSAEANRAGDELRRLEGNITAKSEAVAAARERMARVQSEAAEAELRPAMTAAEQDLERAEKDLQVARKAELARSDDAFAAVKAARAAEEQREAAALAARAAGHALEPVSVFVSRKEGKVFVRQGFAPMHEEPITFADPERPLGTHV